MNTVQTKTKTIKRHILRMDGPISARDIGDFIHQVNSIFRELKGREVQYDDDYWVVGDEEGLTVTIETESTDD